MASTRGSHLISLISKNWATSSHVQHPGFKFSSRVPRGTAVWPSVSTNLGMRRTSGGVVTVSGSKTGGGGVVDSARLISGVVAGGIGDSLVDFFFALVPSPF